MRTSVDKSTKRKTKNRTKREASIQAVAKNDISKSKYRKYLFSLTVLVFWYCFTFIAKSERGIPFEKNIKELFTYIYWINDIVITIISLIIMIKVLKKRKSDVSYVNHSIVGTVSAITLILYLGTNISTQKI